MDRLRGICRPEFSLGQVCLDQRQREGQDDIAACVCAKRAQPGMEAIDEILACHGWRNRIAGEKPVTNVIADPKN
jgi:hypothetical protein